MWQVLFAAAVAGSTGFVARHLLRSTADLNSDHRLGGECEELSEEQEKPRHLINSAFESPLVPNGCKESGHESNYEHKKGIFRFSSSESSDKKIRRLRKKSWIRCRRLEYGVENDKVERRSNGVEASGRRFAVCLKKRRTAKDAPGKCRSCNTKDGSLFSWGLGVGIMYMMSAGKSEISNLTTAMNETSKVVHELRTELYKRKSIQVAARPKLFSSDHTQPLVNRSSAGGNKANNIKVSGLPIIDDVECPSSVLTEEPEPEVLEMDQLEAALEFELQKLPWSTSEASGNELTRPNLGKTEASSEGFHEPEGRGTVSYQCQGVLPSELDQKLCHLLIEQQETQIEELESELHLSQHKLQKKETELQALKDCVRRLTEFSLLTTSDEEAGVPVEQEHTDECINGGGSESRKSTVGMKRPINSA